MTRTGWIVLAVILLLAAGFAATTRFGATTGSSRTSMQPTPIRQTAIITPGELTVPVAGVPRGAIRDTWGEARSEGRSHHGTDIMAAGGTSVLAAADGIIEKLFQSRLGGTTLYERSPDRRWTFYYAHLSGYAPGIAEGVRVRAGQPIAMVGDTGDAGPGNFHLHFGLTRTSPEQHWYEGEDVDAFPYLAGQPLPR